MILYQNLRIQILSHNFTVIFNFLFCLINILHKFRLKPYRVDLKLFPRMHRHRSIAVGPIKLLGKITFKLYCLYCADLCVWSSSSCRLVKCGKTLCFYSTNYVSATLFNSRPFDFKRDSIQSNDC